MTRCTTSSPNGGWHAAATGSATTASSPTCPTAPCCARRWPLTAGQDDRLPPSRGCCWVWPPRQYRFSFTCSRAASRPTVVFPAVRYLITTTQEHQRRLKLQNLLLLLLRTLLIVALVLAAAGPTLPLRGVPGHAPSALALVVDNSPSSGAVVGGSPRMALLRDAARSVLARATRTMRSG